MEPTPYVRQSNSHGFRGVSSRTEVQTMKLEIERKFLVANDDWKLDVKNSSVLRDGLLSGRGDNKVRVRIEGDNASITIKSATVGLTRTEYECPIPLVDAEEMLANLCGRQVCHKTRFLVQCASHIWSVDVYGGVLEGVVIAEIELTHEQEDFVLPGWVGEEVTDQPGYGKWKMLARYTASKEAAFLNAAKKAGPTIYSN